MSELNALEKPTLSALYIEDDETSAKVIKLVLEQATCFNFRVATVPSYREAVPLLKSLPLGLVLLDITLPNGLTPVELTRRIREVTDAPIVVLTGGEPDGNDRELAIEMMREGLIQGYLIKGVDSGKVLQTIRETVARDIGEKKTRRLVRLTERMEELQKKCEQNPVYPVSPDKDSVTNATEDTHIDRRSEGVDS